MKNKKLTPFRNKFLSRIKIENLSVKVNSKEILKKVNLEIKEGEVHALLGPNASGKSTLAYTLMGFPNYKITEGKIIFKRKDIKDLPPEKRVEMGMALVFQNPPTIKGVKLSKLLNEISQQEIDTEEFLVNPNLLQREINVGFSGGERKLSEIIQVISLNPDFVILDELDASLDIKNLELLTGLIKKKLLKNNVSLLLVTHRGDILRFLKPDIVHVMLRGRIICSSSNWKKVWKTIINYDYEKCKKCKFLSS